MFLAAYALSLRHRQPHQAAVPTVKALAVADSTHPVSPYLFVNTVKAFVVRADDGDGRWTRRRQASAEGVDVVAAWMKAMAANEWSSQLGPGREKL
ncbi:hypothetical protein NL676_017597 [Syzygium grande]|nr:hypothetical protein NL676_017597 [Syzygium grande]